MNGESRSYVVNLEQGFDAIDPYGFAEPDDEMRKSMQMDDHAAIRPWLIKARGKGTNGSDSAVCEDPGIQEGRGKKTAVFYNELKRRHVFRAGAAYIVAAWLVAQVADILCGAFDAPDWVMKVILITLALDFPIALIISWYVEITLDGVKWDSNPERVGKIVRPKGRTMDFAIIVVLTAIIGVLLVKHPDIRCITTAAGNASEQIETPINPSRTHGDTVAPTMLPELPRK